MRSRIFLAGLLCMAASLMGGGQSVFAASVSLLSNGMQVLVQEDERFPLVSLRLYVHAGSAYEDPAKAGISHLLEHMVFKGTAKRAPGQVAGDVERAGGYLNASTGFDQTVYTIDLPAEHWKLGLDVLQDMIFGAMIDPGELESEKLVVLSELERSEDSPQRKLFNSLQPLVWPGTSYERPVIGTRETLASITREDIKRYIADLYQPQKMLLVVCGNVGKKQVLPEVERLFGKLTNSRERLPLHPPAISPETGTGPQVTILPGPWKKAYLSVAFPIPGFHTEEATSLEVLGYLLGGDQSSRLYRTFKYERQLVDEISVSPVMLERGGMLVIQAQLDPDKVELFWGQLIEELSILKAESFSAHEFQRTRINLEDSLFQTMETIGGLASKLGFFQFFLGSLKAEERYLFELRHITPDQVQYAIDAHLAPSRLRAVLLLPEQVRLPGEALKESIAEHWKQEAALEPGTPAEQKKQPKVRIENLGHGRSMVIIPDETLPYTALTLTWNGGDSLLPPDRQGLAALTGRALTKGTATMSSPEIEDFLADRAAQLDASSGREQFTLSAKFLTRYSQDIMPLIGRIVSEPAFDPEEVARAKNEQVADIHEREDQPLGLVFRNVFPFLFREHPFAYYHLGMPEEVMAYTPAQLRAFWKEQRSKPWVLSLCGQIDEQAVAELRKTLGRSKPMPAPNPGRPTWSTERLMELTLAERSQAHLLVIFRTPGQGETEATPGLKLLRTALAGQGGMLFRELRDTKGLGYSVTAMLWQTPQAGFLAFYIGTSPDRMDQALAGFREIVERLHEQPLPAEEFLRAKNLLEGDYYRETQSLLARSSEAASLLAKGLDREYNRTIIEKAAALAPDEVQRIAREYLQWDKAYVMKVVP
jgi:zinc protease